MEEQYMSNTKKENKIVYFGSLELLQTMAENNVLYYFKSVKFKDKYPLFGFIAVPKVLKLIEKFSEKHCGGTNHTVDDVSLWKDNVGFITSDKQGIDTIITRNIHIVKSIIQYGYGYRINKIYIDKSGKRVFRFYSCPEIETIKADGDKVSHDKWERKQKNAKEKPVNEAMKKLIDKAMTDAHKEN